MLFGYLDLPWWGYVVYALICTHITIAAVTIFLHRCQAHRALDLHPIVSHFFRAWLWLTTGMKTKAWAAIHRKHHAKTETEEDPHSPQVLGLKQVLFEGAELYKVEAKNAETLERYGKGTPDDWMERNIYTPHSGKGFFITLAVNLFLLGIPGITVWAIQMIWIPFFAAGVINGVGHYWGYRNFECPDAATNIVPWGILIGGEELHNNHHTYPTSAKMSVKWWEFDIGWLYIKTLSLLGLAKVKRLPPKEKLVPGKLKVDLDTLTAVINNRFQLLAQYSKNVMLPIFNQEKANVQNHNELSGIKTYLIRDDSLVDDAERKRLESFLAETKQLKVAYQFRKQLQDIWARTTASQKELIDALQDWCKQAEETGINCLQDFVRYLRSYTIQAAT
ncbi:MAG TPA: fatty acid desaturase [Gammaproteobacteria bacterium]|nr:fatty acid desaturase [Gammaproteobacteria bacterium]